MAEYIEREAFLERVDGIWDCADMVFEPNDKCCRSDDCASCKWRETKNAIRKIAAYLPAADVRPVITCGECKHWETDWTPRSVSDGRHYCAPLDLFPSADWYCSDGEKREES